MAGSVKVGDKVAWRSSGGRSAMSWGNGRRRRVHRQSRIHRRGGKSASAPRTRRARWRIS